MNEHDDLVHSSFPRPGSIGQAVRPALTRTENSWKNFDTISTGKRYPATDKIINDYGVGHIKNEQDTYTNFHPSELDSEGGTWNRQQ